MTSTTTLSIARHMSPPLAIHLVPEHLPAPVAAALETLQAAVADQAAAQRDLAAAAIADKHQFLEGVATAASVVDATLQHFATVNAGSSTGIRDSALGAFTAAMDRANGAVHAALEALTEAGQAADLVASTHPGRPTLTLDSEAAAQAPIRMSLAIARSGLRDVLEQMPDSID